jgi:hypothetical protein
MPRTSCSSDRTCDTALDRIRAAAPRGVASCCCLRRLHRPRRLAHARDRRRCGGARRPAAHVPPERNPHDRASRTIRIGSSNGLHAAPRSSSRRRRRIPASRDDLQGSGARSTPRASSV